MRRVYERSGPNPFIVGDVWRGYLSSCVGTYKNPRNKQSGLVLPRHVVDFLVEDVSPDGNLTFLYKEYTFSNQYYIHGFYDPKTFHVEMMTGSWVNKTIGVTTCNSDGYLSLDMTTLTGKIICPEPCEPGGGEFILRHDRTQFMVSSGGNKAASGAYYSILPGDDFRHAKMFKGKPLFKQVRCTVDGPFCGMHYLHQREINGHHFWLLIKKHGTNEEDEEVIYSAWSDEVTPPLNGWRALKSEDRPAPMVTPIVSSIYELENHHLYDQDKLTLGEDSTMYLLTCGSILIAVLAFVAFLIKRRVKLRFNLFKK